MMSVFLIMAAASAVPAQADTADLIQSVLTPDFSSANRREAIDRVMGIGTTALVPLLDAMGGEDPVPANWLRSAFERIVADKKAEISAVQLDSFLKDATKNARGRRLALATLERLKPGTRDRFLESAIADPAFRYEAIDQLLARIEDRSQEEAGRLLEKAWGSARDPVQVRQISQMLKNHGINANVDERLGLLRSWMVIGPFEDENYTGFARVFPPEKERNLSASYPGKSGPVSWKQAISTASDGRIDLLQSIGNVEGAVGYAFCEFESPKNCNGSLLAGADDNLAVWFNGERVISQGSYHGHLRSDWYQTPVRIRSGVNSLLVKVCQAPPKPDKGPGSPNKWEFVVRITDEQGVGPTMTPRTQTTQPPKGR